MKEITYLETRHFEHEQFMVDIEYDENEHVYNIYVWRKEYGTKDFFYGIPDTIKVDGVEQPVPFDFVLGMAIDGLEGYIYPYDDEDEE